MPEAKDGASIDVEASRPSIDLAAALGLAARHITPASGPPQLDFIRGQWRCDAAGAPREGNLVIDLAAFMKRVMDTPEFRELPSRTPFLKGIQHPRSPVTLKIGGRVPEGSEGAIKDAVAQISRSMKEGIAAALTSSSDGNGVTMLAAPSRPVISGYRPAKCKRISAKSLDASAPSCKPKAGSRCNGCASRMPAFPGAPTRSRGR